MTDAAWLTQQPVAHRGLHDGPIGLQAGQTPENSLLSFQRAMDAGFAIECDLQLAACGTPMVFHDEALRRLTGHDGWVAERTAADLAALPLGETAERVPRLSDMLELVAGRVPLLIEIKGHAQDVGRMESAVWSLLQTYRGEYAVQSFNPYSIAWFAARAPHVLRGQVACDMLADGDAGGLAWWRRFMQTRLWFNWMAKPHFVAYGIRDLHLPAPQRWRRRGLPLLTWTVRTPEQQQKARQLADNIIFETIQP